MVGLEPGNALEKIDVVRELVTAIGLVVVCDR